MKYLITKCFMFWSGLNDKVMTSITRPHSCILCLSSQVYLHSGQMLFEITWTGVCIFSQKYLVGSQTFCATSIWFKPNMKQVTKQISCNTTKNRNHPKNIKWSFSNFCNNLCLWNSFYQQCTIVSWWFLVQCTNVKLFCRAIIHKLIDTCGNAIVLSCRKTDLGQQNICKRRPGGPFEKRLQT